MKFSDILDLAKQGYKPSDIKELLSIDPEPKPEPDPDPKPEPDPDPKPEPDPDPKPDPDPDPKPEPEPELDYKKLYEDTKKKLDALQKANRRHPVEEHEDSVNDIIRDVFY